MAQAPLVLITDFWTGPPDVEQEALGGAARVEVLGPRDSGELARHVARADGLLVWHHAHITRAVIAAAQHCRAIVRIGVGTDNVDLLAAAERNIPVCNVPDYGTEEVADHAVALLLALTRNLSQYQADLRGESILWDARRNPRTPRLRGLRFGIIGLGRIGTATAMRAKAFGMSVLFFDPLLTDGFDKALGLTRADSLEQLLRECDVVSLHCPLNEQTRGMIGDAAFATMKPGAILINTARGSIVDTTAVLRALESGRLAGAGLDVLPVEPPAPDDPLLRAARDPRHVARHRLLLTPHSAFYSEEGFAEMRRKAALEMRRALRGEPLRNRVN